MTPTRGMNKVWGVEGENNVRVLRLTGRGSSNVDFCERTNEGYRMEGVTDPYHRETVRKLRNQMWPVGTLELNALVEIVNGFPKPHANDQKRGDPCRIVLVLGSRDWYFNSVPIMKPRMPIQADTRWIMGLSSAAPNFAPSFARKAIRVKRMKKMDENPRAMAMKAGVVAVGADNQRDTSSGSTERSKRGITSGSVCVLRRSWTNHSLDSEQELYN